VRRGLALALVLAFAGLAAGVARAQTIHSPAFTPNSGGARAYALSGAEVALANDAGAVFVNPARLCFVHGPSFVLGYARLVQDIPSDRGEFSYSQPLGDSIGAPFQREAAYRLALAAAAEYQRLELAQGSQYDEITGSLAAALAPTNILAFGVALRGLRTNSADVDGLDASGMAVDAGFTMALTPNLEVAMVAHNTSGHVHYGDQPNETPGRSFTFALAFARNKWVQGEADWIADYNDASSAALGVEVLPYGALTLRGGLRHWVNPESRTVPSAGIGLQRKGLFLDYAARFDSQDALGLQHRVSLGLRR
jgi:hypothetical protein